MMVVDEKNLTEKYKGKIRFGQQTIQPRKVNTYTEWLEHSTEPNHQWNPEAQFFDVIIEMIVSGSTKTEAELLISDVVNDLVSGSAIRLDDMELYISAEVTEIEKEFVKKWTYKITVTMQGWDKSMDQIVIDMDGTMKNIYVEGNQATPCTIELTPSVDLSSVEISGASYNLSSGDAEKIIIKNLKAGKKVIINGEDCTVLQDGANKFADAEMWEFPILKPGNNTISCSSDKCKVTLKYKPRYV